MLKYRGIVTDRYQYWATRKTKWYTTYADAFKAAEMLRRRTMEERGNISIKQEERK